jgi:outer membrane lipoprotein carrier protein
MLFAMMVLRKYDWCVMMQIKKHIKIIIFIISCIVITNSYAQSVVQDLQAKLVNLHNMSADFAQVVTTEDGTVLQQATGKMDLARPNKFRWETTSGIKQLIVTDGKTLWIYDPDLKQVTIRTLQTSIKQTPMLLLINPQINLQEKFIISKPDVNQLGDWFKLTPKDKNDIFTSIVIGFDNNKIKQIKFSNQLNQQTAISFSNVTTNKKSLTAFGFTIPEGVDVINESQTK